ncbi:hypothetical protein HMSSN036_53280 [Paenibacillus macerans]|nr:hypothetical protein HMSSN036_53280 [Paenibacillus macerans]
MASGISRKKSVEIEALREQTVRREIAEAQRYVQIHTGEKIAMEEMAHRLNLNPSHFSRIFKQETGETFVEFVTRTKMERAQELLNQSDLNVTEIPSSLDMSIRAILSSFSGISPACPRTNSGSRFNLAKKGWNSMLAIRKATDSLEEEELRAYLRLILVQIERMKEEGAAPNTAITGLIELYDGLIALPDKKRIVWDPAPACTHVHIVIGDSFAGSMKQALKGLGWEEAHKLIVLRENYAIGPLADLDSPAGRTARSEWFGDNIMNGLEAYSTYEDEYMVLLGKLEQIPEQAEVVVWTTRNACEQAGMRYALHLLRHKPNPLSVYDACAICEALYNGRTPSPDIGTRANCRRLSFKQRLSAWTEAAD